MSEGPELESILDFIINLKVGDKVYDDLTREIHTVTDIKYDKDGNLGYWLDSPYLDGARFGWEISSPEKETE